MFDLAPDYDYPFRMAFNKFCSPKYLLGALFAAMALVAFNLGRPGIEADTASAFNAWYRTTAEKLAPSADVNGYDSALDLTVTINVNYQQQAPSTWRVPSTSLRDPQERENTARVLQLIRESGVFGFAGLRNPTRSITSMTLTIKDGDQIFETTVPYGVVEQNIQLQNLLKLLEVFSSQTSTNPLEPARL